jgi:hypothetical protein
MGRLWTEPDDQYLEDHHELPDEIIARALDRTPKSIYDRRRTIGVPPMSGWEGIRKPVAMSQYEKVYRIQKMAMDMRIKLKG